MTEAIAVVAPRLSQARRAATGPVTARLPGATLSAFSLARYGREPGAPSNIVLWVGDQSVADSLAFLQRARARLFLPPAGRDFGEAIAGLRGGDPPAVRGAAPDRPAGGRGRLAEALLLEGILDERRVRSALAARSPRDWIVESARLVRLSDRRRADLSRHGVRLLTLEPVTLVAVGMPAGLARRRDRWRKLLPASAEVWT